MTKRDVHFRHVFQTVSPKDIPPTPGVSPNKDTLQSIADRFAVSISRVFRAKRRLIETGDPDLTPAYNSENRRTLSDDEEEKLLKYLTHRRENKQIVNYAVVKDAISLITQTKQSQGWIPSDSVVHDLLDKFGMSYRSVTPVAQSTIRSSYDSEVAHFRFNVANWPKNKIYCVDETNVTFSTLPNRTFDFRGSTQVGVVAPDNIRNGSTSVIIMIGYNGLNFHMTIPHHGKRPKTQQNRECAAQSLGNVCDCSPTKSVAGIHDIHWTNFLHRVLPQVGRGSAIIIDQLNCHMSKATLELFGMAGVTPLYMYPKTAKDCSPLDNGYFAVFKKRYKDNLRGREPSPQVVAECVQQAIDDTRHQQSRFFEGCGYGATRVRHRITLPPPVPLTVLPFGLPPPDAKLGRSQKAADLVRVPKRGRPKLSDSANLDQAASAEDNQSASKRPRLNPKFTTNQRDKLVTFFENDHFPPKSAKVEICSEIGLTEYQLDNWLAAERRRRKKMNVIPVKQGPLIPNPS